MAFEQITSLECEISYGLGGVDKKTRQENPTSITGYYLGSKNVPSQKSKTGFTRLHVFQTANGNEGVWGKKNLDDQMVNVTPGLMVRVTFVGMKETKNNPMYVYRIEADRTQTIDVSTAQSSTDETQYSDEGQEYQGGEAEQTPPDEVQPARPQAPAAPARAPSLQAQQNVKNILANKGQRRPLGA